jgi:hypothetical protein
MAALRASNLLGWPPPLVLSGSQDPAGCACIPPGVPPSQNQPNRIGWEGVSKPEAVSITSPRAPQRHHPQHISPAWPTPAALPRGIPTALIRAAHGPS